MNKNDNINIRISKTMKEQVLIRAAQLGMKISDYIRYLITKDIQDNQ